MPDHDMQHGLMVDYIGGSLPAPLSLMVASHIAINEEAQSDYQALSEFGGLMLENSEQTAMGDGALNEILDKLDQIPQETARLNSSPAKDHSTKTIAGDVKVSDNLLPAPLRDVIKVDLDDLEWKRLGGGVAEYVLPLSRKGLKASLLKIEAGRKVPDHTHKGREYTLILDGAFNDAGQIIKKGDFICNDPSDTHGPQADATQGCLCFVVQDAPLKFKGLLGFILNPFLKV